MNIRIFDIETLKEQFLATFYDPQTNTWLEFSINKNEYDGFKLIKYLSEPDFQYLVGFNSVAFDAQVLEHIVRNHDKWVDLSNLQICNKIAEFAQDCIERSNYGLFPIYREEYFINKHIDLFKIHHFDNENRRTGLKWLEFMMDLPNVEEMPVHYTKEDLTDEEINIIKSYCRNDVLATHKFYLYTVGEVSNPFYKGKNKIQDRFDVIEEYNFPPYALNWSDVKIGDEINLKGYSELTGHSRTDVYKRKLERGPTKKFTFKHCIPDYVEFVTPEFQQFHKSILKERVLLTEKQKFKFSYNKTTYTIAKGGIHSNETNRTVEIKQGEILEDADVGSQYPNAIVKRKLFPSHLGSSWLNNYDLTIKKRLRYKDLGATSNRHKGVAEMLKLALNGGG